MNDIVTDCFYFLVDATSLRLQPPLQDLPPTPTRPACLAYTTHSLLQPTHIPSLSTTLLSPSLSLRRSFHRDQTNHERF
jgi:hypothetical protein